jgi:teichuronic acid biosynthesis glycosyltransferase TuaC
MSAAKAPLLDFVQRDPGADVLVVTNMWPDDERPVYGIFVKRQVDSLRAAGVRCDVVYLRGYRSAAAYPFAAARFLGATLAWRGRYRLVHVHAGETALAARFFAGPPMLVSYCGDDVLGDPNDDGIVPLAGRVRAAVIRGHAALCSATITKSQEMHDRLPPRIRRKDTVLPNGVDRSLFTPIDRAEARRRVGWAADERVVLFAATKPDIPRKRRKLAEAACAAAAERIGPIRLHIAGLAPPDEVPVLMSAADCLLHTSSLEGSPNVVKEALMCNLPVVATASGDIPLLLEGVEPSYICAPDAAALGEALVGLFAAPTRSNGRSRVAEKLSSDAVASRLLELYSRLATPARPLTPATVVEQG